MTKPARKQRLSVYLDPVVMNRLAEHAARRDQSRSLIAEAAIESFLSPDAAERQEAAITKRLDQVDRRMSRLRPSNTHAVRASISLHTSHTGFVHRFCSFILSSVCRRRTDGRTDERTKQWLSCQNGRLFSLYTKHVCPSNPSPCDVLITRGSSCYTYAYISEGERKESIANRSTQRL